MPTTPALVDIDCRSTTGESLLRRIAGHRFPLYFSSSFEARATLEAGSTEARVLVCSVPKAGTYLLGALLKRLGVADTGLHIGPTWCTDYRFAHHEQARERPRDLGHPFGLDMTLPLVGPGQFVVGHLPCTADVRARAANFRLILAIRDLREAAASMMRFLLQTGRTPFGGSVADWRSIREPKAQFAAFLEAEGEPYIKEALALADWMNIDSVQPVRFETLVGDAGTSAQIACLQAVATHVGLPCDAHEAERALRDALQKRTLTWSGGRTEQSQFWSPQADSAFERIGGAAANRLFGYTT